MNSNTMDKRHRKGLAICAAAVLTIVIISVMRMHRANKKAKAQAHFCGAWDPASVAELQALGAMSTYE